MRILVDESLPIGLAAELAGFDVLLTADRALRYQQNLARIGIGVVLVVRVRNRMRELRPLLPRITAAFEQVRTGELIEISG